LARGDRVQEVKGLVAELTRQNMVESEQHPTVERPWGYYTVMDEGPGFKVKRIVVDPGKRLSLQMHQHRAEHWVVVSGTARVTIGQETRSVVSNQSVYISPKTRIAWKIRKRSLLRSSRCRPGLTWGKMTLCVSMTITGDSGKNFAFEALTGICYMFSAQLPLFLELFSINDRNLGDCIDFYKL
jgi:mannose-6-phosphate isomerase-like protein (cupin superfamily)